VAVVAAGQPADALLVEDLPGGLRGDRHALGGAGGGDLGDAVPGRAQFQDRRRSWPVALRGPFGPGLASANMLSLPLRSMVAIWCTLAVEYPNRSATSAAGMSSRK